MTKEEKYKKTCLERYGVPCNLLINVKEMNKKIWKEQHDKIILKRNITLNERYNCGDNFLKSEYFKEKSKNTLIKNYGSIENAYNVKTIKSKETKKKKYGSENYNNSNKTKITLENKHKTFEINNNCTKYTTLLKLYGQGWKSLNLPVIYNGRFRYISNEYLDIIKKYSSEFHNVKDVSNVENELYNFIKANINYKILKNVKNIIKNNNINYELDIYIPDLNLAFEFNGNYWHSNAFKDKYYHQNKTIACYNNNIQLIHIYEFNWINNKEEIKNNIINLLNKNDCSYCNWISLNDFHNYLLSEPNEYKFRNYIIYDEGTFIKK